MNVECPTCRATINKPCVGIKGRNKGNVATSTHNKRLELSRNVAYGVTAAERITVILGDMRISVPAGTVIRFEVN